MNSSKTKNEKQTYKQTIRSPTLAWPVLAIEVVLSTDIFSTLVIIR
jgi:hypothetical protein